MMKKTFLVAILLMTSIDTANAKDTAKLLLVREGANDLKCNVSVVQGKLYGVPNHVKLEDIDSLFDITLLEFLSSTQELPYEDDVNDASSVPVGIYDAYVRSDESKKWMKGNINKSWRIELLKTKHRERIQFHYGPDKSWSSGCIILTGEGHSDFYCGIQNSSEKAVQRVREYVTSIFNSSDDKDVKIKIIWKTSL